jgi:hypothetical protein
MARCRNAQGIHFTPVEAGAFSAAEVDPAGRNAVARGCGTAASVPMLVVAEGFVSAGPFGAVPFWVPLRVFGAGGC